MTAYVHGLLITQTGHCNLYALFDMRVSRLSQQMDYETLVYVNFFRCACFCVTGSEVFLVFRADDKIAKKSHTLL